jgi:hypothetical protein
MTGAQFLVVPPFFPDIILHRAIHHKTRLAHGSSPGRFALASVVQNLKARTEIHDAWANIVLADTHLAEGKDREAGEAMLDAEHHYRCAQAIITINTSDSVLDRLAALKTKLDQVRSPTVRVMVAHSK